MGKGAKKQRRAEEAAGCVVTDKRPKREDKGEDKDKAAAKQAKAEARARAHADLPVSLAAYAHATEITGAKKVKKKCCRSTPRCKGCPVLLMRAARLQEAGLTGKDLKRAVKKARAA